jgi:hypothetical protein
MSCPSLYRQAVQCSIAEPSIVKPSIAEPSSPLSPSRPLRAVHHDIAEPSIATLPSRPALYHQAVAVHRQAVHCQAVHCAKLSIASCPSRHRQAVHRSIAKPFFASCPSRAVHRFIVKLSSSITSCPSLYRRAVQRFIAEPSIAKPSIAQPSNFCRCPSPPNAKALSIIHQS